MTLVLVCIFTAAHENTRTTLVTNCPTHHSYFARCKSAIRGWPPRQTAPRVHVTTFSSAACDSARKRAGPSSRLTARTRHARFIRRRGTPTREKRAFQVVSVSRCSATRVERRAYDEIGRTVQQHGMVRAERNAHRERAACLPRESHNQLCATIAMGRLGSEQACLPRATEFGRDLPRSTYEGTHNDGRGRGSTTSRSNGRARTRPELNLKFTDGE